MLTRWRSYHGSTYGTGGLSGDSQTRTFEAHAATKKDDIDEAATALDNALTEVFR